MSIRAPDGPCWSVRIRGCEFATASITGWTIVNTDPVGMREARRDRDARCRRLVVSSWSPFLPIVRVLPDSALFCSNSISTFPSTTWTRGTGHPRAGATKFDEAHLRQFPASLPIQSAPVLFWCV